MSATPAPPAPGPDEAGMHAPEHSEGGTHTGQPAEAGPLAPGRDEVAPHIRGAGALPEHGRDPQQILAQLGEWATGDPAYRQGRMWSLVYYLDEAYHAFQGEAQQLFASTNGLNPTAFRSLKRFEDEIVASTAALQHGTPGVCGVLTSGGTESCLLAVKTYRDLARATRRVRRPEMVLPRSAHVAWIKASEYFGVRIRWLALDQDLRADASALDALINRNTVLVLASAPDYPHGNIDPIEAMGAIAQRRGVPLHVDACVGGFILPFMEMNGVALPHWDYRVPGVSSISADLHKYGYASKGVSTLTYRELALLKHQMFVHVDWPGGVFASPGLLGTRPGGAWAAAWAALQYFGSDGYRDLAARTQQAFSRMREAIAAMPELKVLGDPCGPLLAYGARERSLDIFAVGDQMQQRGWHINRLQRPDGLHAMITAQHLAVVDDYLRDLRASVEAVQADPALAEQGEAATYGMLSHLPLRGMVKGRVLDLFSQMYQPGGCQIDLAGAAHVGSGTGDAAPVPLLERLARWYLCRRR